MYGRGKFIIRNIISAIVAILIVIFSFLAIFNIAFNIIYTKRDVIGFSMQPTLNTHMTDREKVGDIVYVNQFADVNVGDVVVAEVKWWDCSIIKRLVGKPGDTVKLAIENDKYALYCNDKLLYTRPADFETVSYCSKTITYVNTFPNSYFDENNNFYIELQENEYFLMGDHWTSSMLDCLSRGPVKKSEIIGRVEILIKENEKNKIHSLGKSLIHLIFGKKVSL